MRDQLAHGDPLAARHEGGGAAERDLDLAALGRAIRARKFHIIIPTLAMLALSAIVVHVIPPKYKSTASVILQQQESTFTRPTGAQPSAEQQVIDDQAVASQVQVIMSRDLATKAIQKLGLVGNPEFDPAAAGFGPLSRILVVLGLVKNPLDQPPEERVLDAYYDALSAYQVEKSRVISIDFGSKDPNLSAKAANTIAQLYIEAQRAAKRGESLGASEALSPQIDELRRNVVQAEAAVEDFRTKNGLFNSDNGMLTTQQLTEINTQLSSARAQQAESQAKARMIRDLLKAGRPVDVSDVTNNELLRRLVEQRVNLKAQLASESRTLLPGHPRIKELNAQLADLQSQIAIEAQKTTRSLENDAKIAGARVQSLEEQLNHQKAQSATSNDQEVQLRALERDAKSKRDLLEAYLARFQEATARASFTDLPADAKIISQAVPTTQPYFPKKLPIIFIATMAALVLSVALVAASELLSGRALIARAETAPVEPSFAPARAFAVEKSPHDSEPPHDPEPPQGPPPSPGRKPFWAALETRPADIPAANAAPAVAAATAASAQLDEQIASAVAAIEPEPVPAPAAEAVPEAATAVEDSELDRLADKLCALHRHGPPDVSRHSVLFVGSRSRGDVALAASQFARRLAGRGARVVLVDLDLGHDASAQPGLADLLTGEASFLDAIERDAYSRLHLVRAGRAVDGLDPALMAGRLSTIFEALAATYDFVICDGGVLSGEDDPRGPVWGPIAAACESALVVTVPGEAPREAEARQILAALGARDVSTVEGIDATRAA